MTKTINSNLISKQVLLNIKSLRKKADKAEDQIFNRLKFIMSKVLKTFNLKNTYWYVLGAQEGTRGNFWNAYDGVRISIEMSQDGSLYFNKELDIILKNNKKWSLIEDGIPARWLFENFESELVNGKKLFNKINKQALLDEKKRDAKTLSYLKKKLSSKELDEFKNLVLNRKI